MSIGSGPSYPTATPSLQGPAAAAPTEAPAKEGWFTKPAAGSEQPGLEGDTRATGEQGDLKFEKPPQDDQAVKDTMQAGMIDKVVANSTMSGHSKVDKLLAMAHDGNHPMSDANRLKAYRSALKLVDEFSSGDTKEMTKKVMDHFRGNPQNNALPYDDMVKFMRLGGQDYGPTSAEVKAQVEQERAAKNRAENAGNHSDMYGTNNPEFNEAVGDLRSKAERLSGLMQGQVNQNIDGKYGRAQGQIAKAIEKLDSAMRHADGNGHNVQLAADQLAAVMGEAKVVYHQKPGDIR